MTSFYKPKEPVLDLWHILKTRNNSFELWAAHEGVSTLEGFRKRKSELETQGYFLSDEMVSLAISKLPSEMVPPPPSPVVVVVVVDEEVVKPVKPTKSKSQKKTSSQESTETTTPPLPTSLEGDKAEECDSSTKEIP